MHMATYITIIRYFSPRRDKNRRIYWRRRFAGLRRKKKGQTRGSGLSFKLVWEMVFLGPSMPPTLACIFILRPNRQNPILIRPVSIQLGCLRTGAIKRPCSVIRWRRKPKRWFPHMLSAPCPALFIRNRPARGHSNIILKNFYLACRSCASVGFYNIFCMIPYFGFWQTILWPPFFWNFFHYKKYFFF